jgi:hypothetical protein
MREVIAIIEPLVYRHVGASCGTGRTSPKPKASGYPVSFWRARQGPVRQRRIETQQRPQTLPGTQNGVRTLSQHSRDDRDLAGEAVHVGDVGRRRAIAVWCCSRNWRLHLRFCRTNELSSATLCAWGVNVRAKPVAASACRASFWPWTSAITSQGPSAVSQGRPRSPTINAGPSRRLHGWHAIVDGFQRRKSECPTFKSALTTAS